MQYLSIVSPRVVAILMLASLAFAEAATAEPLRVWVTLSAPVLTARQRQAVREEVDRIWKPYDVELQWRDRNPEYGHWPGLVVTVRVDDEKTVARGTEDAPVLGEVRVVGNRMLPTIKVSPQGVQHIVAAGISRSDNFPRYSYVYARFIGRVVAHEFGHLLSQSREHAKTGLMRPRFTFRDAVSEDRHAFRLEPEIVARLVDPTRERGVLVADASSGPR